MQCCYFLHFFQTLDFVRLCHVESGLIYCRVETWPARSLLEALQQEEASILFSLRGKKQNFTGTKCLVGPCVSNTKRRKRREPSANFYVPRIFCMQRMQCILAEIYQKYEPKARRVQDLEGASAVRVPCANIEDIVQT